MLKYVVKRLILMVPVIIGITLLIYLVLDLSPADPVIMMLGGQDFTLEEYAAQKEAMGLNAPFLVRYSRYIWNVLHGDFGTSWINGRSVSDEFVHRLPYTLYLGIFANLISIFLGIPFGVVSGVRHNRLTDYFFTFLSLILASAPVFWLGMLGQMYLGLRLGFLPVSGADSFMHYILPAFVLAGALTAQNTRITRTWLVDVIRSDYVRTARAKGAHEFTVIVKHALRNALLPVITVLGNHFAVIMGSSVVIETVFAIPGSSSMLIQAVKTSDIPIVMGCIFIIAIFVGIVNLLVDLIYALVDPRVKYS